MTVSSQLSADETVYLRAKVDRVLLLLNASAQPPEVKTAWVTLLPHMTLSQVDQLTALLEAELETTLRAARQHPENDELILKLTAAKQKYEAAHSQANAAALATVQKIEQELQA